MNTIDVPLDALNLNINQKEYNNSSNNIKHANLLHCNQILSKYKQDEKNLKKFKSTNMYPRGTSKNNKTT